MRDSYQKTIDLSFGLADFPSQLEDRFNLGFNPNAQKGILEIGGSAFRLAGTNTLFNPSDFGQFLWGSWMKANGFTYLEARLGSQINENFTRYLKRVLKPIAELSVLV